MYNHILYLAYWGINASVFFIASKIFVGDVVVGNYKFLPLEASIYSAFWVTFSFWVLWDVLASRKIKLRNKLIEIVFFWGANTVSIWGAARFSNYIGFGISSSIYAILLGLIVYILQQIAFIKITSQGK